MFFWRQRMRAMAGLIDVSAMTRWLLVVHIDGLLAVPTNAEAIGIHPCNRNVFFLIGFC